jgi:hypothetical protein
MVAALDPLVLDFPYGFDGPHTYSGTGTYANRDADVSWVTVQYAHSLGEVVTAAATSGLTCTYLTEHLSGSFNTGQFEYPEDDGRYRLRLGESFEREGERHEPEPLPVLFTFLAQRDAS